MLGMITSPSAPRFLALALAGAMSLAACGGSAAPPASSVTASAPPASSAAVSSAGAKPSGSIGASAAASASAGSAASAASGGPSSAAASGSGAASAAATASGPAAAKPSAAAGGTPVPSVPGPVPVSLDPSTTAYLVLDITSANCPSRPSCTASLPAISSLLKKARDAKVAVVYSSIAAPGATILPAVAPLAGDPTVTASADKFIGTDLENILKQKHATNLVIVGSSANGAVMYTAYEANALGFTVAVPVDGLSSAVSPLETMLAEYQMLQQPGAANTDNKPLTPKAVTLTRTDLVTFGGASGASGSVASGSPAPSGAPSSAAAPASAGGSAGAASSPVTAGSSAPTSAGSLASAGGPAASAGAAALPAVPAPAPAALDAKTTALLVLDINTGVCKNLPACMATLPAINALIKKARDAKATVIYSDFPAGSSVLPDVSPQPDDTVVKALADKFIGTNLQDVLKQKGITSVVVTGAVANGAVLYTTFHANALGLTAVVPVDTMPARQPFDQAWTQYQLLHEPGAPNIDNKPLTGKSVTLSKSDLVTFK